MRLKAVCCRRGVTMNVSHTSPLSSLLFKPLVQRSCLGLDLANDILDSVCREVTSHGRHCVGDIAMATWKLECC